MLKSIDNKNNIIYGDLSLQKNLKLEFKGSNNIAFLIGSSINFNVIFHGNNSLLFHGGGSSFNNYFKNCIDIQNNGICYIGRKSTFNGVFFRICEGKNIIIGDDCMFSWDIWICPTDSHLIFDTDTYKRVNFGKSIYIGDHIWCGQEAAILKGSFIASGSILGAKSVISGTKFSNSIYAGNPAKLIKKNKFWSREDPTNGDWSKEKIRQFSAMQKEDFKFNFEKDKFLNPNLFESKLEKLETAQQKLEFVYDYIYNNTNKNRFALFENSNTNLYQLYKDKNQISFSQLKFDKLENKEESASKLFGALFRIQNQLSYKLGQNMIINSKNIFGIIFMPIYLLSIFLNYKKEQKIYKQKIKKDPSLKLPPLESYPDYNEALKFKEHLSYKLGEALIKANNNWYGGGYIKLWFEIRRIEKEFKNKKA